MSINKKVTIVSLLLILTILIFHITNLDISIQNIFYLGSNQWLINKDDYLLKLFFYTIPKRITLLIGIILLFLTSFFLFISRKRSNNQLKNQVKKMLLVLLSVIFVPLIIAGAKQITNMHCPDDIINFGGDNPYIKILDQLPENINMPKKGKCYPAGHATAGFSLLSIAYIIKKRIYKILTFVSISFFGWIIGLYQIAKGAHFFSDTLVSMLASIIIISILYKLIYKE